ncbi:unnamed protein product [Amoebophrya sp. A120]|nr:unnamed protein product [Amoebophrya sp. A120]|eukprot:GSA120T00025333001.1
MYDYGGFTEDEVEDVLVFDLIANFLHKPFLEWLGGELAQKVATMYDLKMRYRWFQERLQAFLDSGATSGPSKMQLAAFVNVDLGDTESVPRMNTKEAYLVATDRGARVRAIHDYDRGLEVVSAVQKKAARVEHMLDNFAEAAKLSFLKARIAGFSKFFRSFEIAVLCRYFDVASPRDASFDAGTIGVGLAGVDDTPEARRSGLIKRFCSSEPSVSPEVEAKIERLRTDGGRSSGRKMKNLRFHIVKWLKDLERAEMVTPKTAALAKRHFLEGIPGRSVNEGFLAQLRNEKPFRVTSDPGRRAELLESHGLVLN